MIINFYYNDKHSLKKIIYFDNENYSTIEYHSFVNKKLYKKSIFKNGYIDTIFYYDCGYVSKRKKFLYNTYEKKSIIYKVECFNKLGLYHNITKPAVIYYDDNGKPRSLYHYLNDKLHNSVGPSIIKYRQNKVHLTFCLNGIVVNNNTFFYLLKRNLTKIIS